MDEFRFDVGALLRECMNRSLNDIVVAAQPDEETQKATRKMLEVCNRHGISTQKVIEITMDFLKEGEGNG